MIDYFKKKLETILDSIVDPMISKIVALSWNIRIIILIFAVAISSAIAYPEAALRGATTAKSFVRIWLQSSKDVTLSAKTTARLHSSRQVLWATLNSMLDNTHDPQLTPWVAAQIASARSEPSSSFKAELDSYFQSTKILDCSCWRELPHTERSPRLIHVSGWVLSAKAQTELVAPDDEIAFLLDKQTEAGWWPMYVIASVSDANASTYATSWALLGLQAQFHLMEGNTNMQARMEGAIAKGSAWLIRTRAEPARWKDYPLSEVGRVSESISGLVLHALNTVNVSIAGDLSRQWLGSLPASAPLPDAVEQSGILTETADGPQTDYYLQFRLPWLIIGTVDAYQYGSTAEKVAAASWLDKAILQEGVRKMEREPLPWKRAELLVALRYLEARLSSQH